jgi:hypothetical protein
MKSSPYTFVTLPIGKFPLPIVSRASDLARYSNHNAPPKWAGLGPAFELVSAYYRFVETRERITNRELIWALLVSELTAYTRTIRFVAQIEWSL